MGVEWLKRIKKFGKVFYEFDVFDLTHLYIIQMLLGFLLFLVLLLRADSLASLFISFLPLYFVWLGWTHIENIIFELVDECSDW